MRLSRVDQRKLESGEFDSIEDAIHQYDATVKKPEAGAGSSDGQGSAETKPAAEVPMLSARDREILADRPPHFGKL